MKRAGKRRRATLSRNPSYPYKRSLAVTRPPCGAFNYPRHDHDEHEAAQRHELDRIRPDDIDEPLHRSSLHHGTELNIPSWPEVSAKPGKTLIRRVRGAPLTRKETAVCQPDRPWIAFSPTEPRWPKRRPARSSPKGACDGRQVP